jgi:hypothetical protein
MTEEENYYILPIPCSAMTEELDYRLPHNLAITEEDIAVIREDKLPYFAHISVDLNSSQK